MAIKLQLYAKYMPKNMIHKIPRQPESERIKRPLVQRQKCPYDIRLAFKPAMVLARFNTDTYEDWATAHANIKTEYTGNFAQET
ncbi:uncharacterized protein CIMG_09674 [Coccidioides immitis RS]|uniref:Uncharacterized protein n=1 Tax=Coccidioides immitis (strain RS) TaxID=246410 RepID=J3K2W5_COCIM|nr:uncharacterized protein CIMG_09674 [Coccidioides immitis RS]EAS28470.3 hypothetical protein CIMG_09674 [Coccidioides immitis RS]